MNDSMNFNAIRGAILIGRAKKLGANRGLAAFRSLMQMTGLVLAFAASLIAPVSAQDFPVRPVTIVVPYPPGGIADLYARVVAEQLAKQWKQPVVIDNKAGGGTVIGTQFVSQARADGHTILLTGYGFTSNQVLLKRLPYDPRSLTALVLMGHSNSVLVLGPNTKAHSLSDLVALAKSKPGALRLASSGNGSSPHIAAAQFASLIDADVTHVPYKGTAPAMSDIIGGQVDGIFDGPSSLLQLQTGKLRAIAIAAPERHPFALDVPTFRELGLDFVTGGWFGFFVPAQSPAAAKKKIYDDLRMVLKSPETRALIGRGGMTFTQATPDEFQNFLAEDLRRLKELVANPRLHFDVD